MMLPKEVYETLANGGFGVEKIASTTEFFARKKTDEDPIDMALYWRMDGIGEKSYQRLKEALIGHGYRVTDTVRIRKNAQRAKEKEQAARAREERKIRSVAAEARRKEYEARPEFCPCCKRKWGRSKTDSSCNNPQSMA